MSVPSSNGAPNEPADARPSRMPDLLPLAVVLFAALIVVSPLLQPGYFWGAHDARHDAYFIFQYSLSAEEGIWFPRWSPDWTFGYGYPFFIVYGPFATFLGVLFHKFLGLGFEASVKAVLGFSVLLSGLGMYGFARSWLGRWGAVVAAVAYMAIPYHLVDLYVRAAMAESVGLALLPFALWGFRAVVQRPQPLAILGAAVAYALIMWTSPLVALVFTPALALYVLFLIVQRLRLNRGNRPAVWPALFGATWPAALAGALGLGLSAAFFVPALLEQRYINQTQWFGEYYDPAQHFVFFHQLFHPAWGFGISQPGPDDTAQSALSFQLGAAATLFSVIAIAFSRHFSSAVRKEVWFWAVWAGGAVFLSLGISALAWQYVPLVPYAQFPWRYLMLAIIPLSILPGALLAPSAQGDEVKESGRTGAWPALLLVALLLMSSYPFLNVAMIEPTPEQGPVSMAALMRFQRTSDEMTGVTAWVDPEQRPKWSDIADLWVQGKDVTTRVDYSTVPQSDRLAVNAEGVGTAHEQIWYHAGEPGQSITFNRFWYPGWSAWLLDGKDGRPVQRLPVLREEGPLARVVVPVPIGEAYVLLRFEDTPLRAAAKWTSIVTAVFGVLLVVATSRRAHRAKERENGKRADR